MDTPSHLVVDHINRKPLDNRRSNLRNCTTQQNNLNKPGPKRCASKYKGVTWVSSSANQHWLACATLSGKTHRIGRFYTQEQAAYAYNEFVKLLFGEFAFLNVIEAVDFDPASSFDPRWEKRFRRMQARQKPSAFFMKPRGYFEHGETPDGAKS